MAQPDDTAAIISTFQMALTHPVMVFLTMTFVTKMCAFVALILLALCLVMAVARRFGGGKYSGVLANLGLIALAVSALGAIYGGLLTYLGAQAQHVTRLVIVLPSLIEAGACLLVGVVALLVAMAGNAGAKRG